MNQCNTLNVKLSNSYLNKIKPAIENRTEENLKHSSNVAGGFND